MSIAERLAELGIELPQVRAPLALYRPAVTSGNHVYVSGQVATRDGQIVHPGRLGVNVTTEQGQEAARVAAINALAALHAHLGTLDGIRVIRLAGYVACSADYTDQPAVMNGASELLRDVLGEADGVGTRVALGVAALPAGSPVELELVVELS